MDLEIGLACRKFSYRSPYTRGEGLHAIGTGGVKTRSDHRIACRNRELQTVCCRYPRREESVRTREG